MECGYYEERVPTSRTRSNRQSTENAKAHVQEILATLHAVTENRTSISIAHRLSTIADADTIFVLDQGRLAESGTHADLLRHDGLYAEMWTRQANEQAELSEAAE